MVAVVLPLVVEKPCLTSSLDGGCEASVLARCDEVVKAAWVGEHGGGDSMGGAELLKSKVRPLCSSLPECAAHTVPLFVGSERPDSGQLVMCEGLHCATGSIVEEPHMTDPLLAAAVYSCGFIHPVLGGSVLRGSVGLGDGGSVSEEVWFTPTAREALRLQPIDGLRQPPSSSAVPESGVAPVVPVRGVDGGGGKVRSFATVVSPDRRADVEISFDSSVDGSNVVVMEESDGQEDEWRECLIGYFLQGSISFGLVRSTVSRLWTSLGQMEVKSLDNGFFIFRFTDPSRRDAVFESGPWFGGASPSYSVGGRESGYAALAAAPGIVPSAG
ncbi:hypothetical protein Dimus_024693 [Dionaea muscipula]